MYYTIGAVFCIGFVVGMAFGMVRGKKELASELQQQCNNISPEVSRFISDYLK